MCMEFFFLHWYGYRHSSGSGQNQFPPFYHAKFPNLPPNIHQNTVNPIILLLTGIVERYYFCYRYFFCYHVFLFVLLYFYVNTTSPSYAHYRNFISFSMPITETVHLPSPYPPRSLDPPPSVTDFATLLCPSQSLSLIQYIVWHSSQNFMPPLQSSITPCRPPSHKIHIPFHNIDHGIISVSIHLSGGWILEWLSIFSHPLLSSLYPRPWSFSVTPSFHFHQRCAPVFTTCSSKYRHRGHSGIIFLYNEGWSSSFIRQPSLTLEFCCGSQMQTQASFFQEWGSVIPLASCQV